MDLLFFMLRYGGAFIGTIGMLGMILGSCYARQEWKAARHSRRRQRDAWRDFCTSVIGGGVVVGTGLIMLLVTF
jgi:hypothetical protein